MTDAVDLTVKKRDTMLTARQRADSMVDNVGVFDGHIIDASGNRFVDASGNTIYNQDSSSKTPVITSKQRDTMLTRKDRENG